MHSCHWDGHARANLDMPPPARRFVNASLFLGAGASAPYGKPTTKAFKDALLQQTERGDIWHAVLSSPQHEDVEAVFSVVEDLAALAQNDGGRFYAEYNNQVKNEINIIYNAYHVLVNELYEAYAWNHEYNDALQHTLGPLVAMLEGLSKTVNIFTTNYDRSVEQYCDIADPQIELVDGFVPSGGKYVWTGWPYPPGNVFSDEDQQEGTRRVRLYKLHGSLTWRSNLAMGGIVKNESEELSRDKNYGNLLIYPSRSPKFIDDEPYNTTFEAFSTALGLSDACIVVGFSLRDVYITAKFKELLDAGKLLIVVDPDALNTIEKSMPEYTDIVLIDAPGSTSDLFLRNDDGSGRGRILVIQESLDSDTSHKIANRVLEYVQLWDAEAGL